MIIIIILIVIIITIILTLRLTQSNQWVGEDHATPMTGSIEKNKMIVMMTMMI